MYIQAKRYTNNRVGTDDIRNFIGSLDTRGAYKGVLITAADFTAEARQTATEGSKLILLVNGQELARMMIRHNVGVVTRQTYTVQQLDENYFSPD